MDRQKLPPPVSTKITRKLASESTEHNSLLNFYSSISTDETGAPKRWKMSTSVHFDEDVIASGKTSPVPPKVGTSRDRSPVPPQKLSTSRDSSMERKGRPGLKRGVKEKDIVDSTSSRESSLEGKEKGRLISDSKRDSSSDSKKGKKSEESGKKIKGLDKSKFYTASSSKVNGDSAVKTKRRPKSLDLKSEDGEDDSFKSPDPLTPCNIAVKRRKGRPKETPPTLIAESPVELLEETSGDTVPADFDIEEPVEADIEDNIETFVKTKPIQLIQITEISKSRGNTVLGKKKHLKGPRLVTKLKKNAGNIQRIKIETKIPGQKPVSGHNVKKRVGRPPGAKNKTTLLKEHLAKLAKQAVKPEFTNLLETPSSSMDCTSNNEASENPPESAAIQTESNMNIEGASLIPLTLKVKQKSKKRKTLKMKGGGIKSLGKVKKESKEEKKVIKKRILNSYATNSDTRSLDHLPKNDLRRYLQMKLIERLNGNRANNMTMLKPSSDKEVKSDLDEIYSEEDSLGASDPMKDPDIQYLSALVEQKRIGSDMDVSLEHRPSVGRPRKSSVDLAKFSDNESVSSEKSTNSNKRIFVLGENNTESDDSIRTRQRVEIVPGKSRKRTLSGEFDLVDENRLRKEKKMARLSGIESIAFSHDLGGEPVVTRGEITPVVSPIKVQKKTSPKVAAIKQRMEAKKEPVSPFASEHMKRLLKQSPFLSRMRKKGLPGNRLIDVTVRNKELSTDHELEVFSMENIELKNESSKSEQTVQERLEFPNTFTTVNDQIVERASNIDVSKTSVESGASGYMKEQALELKGSLDIQSDNTMEVALENQYTESETASEETNVNTNKGEEIFDVKGHEEVKPFLIENEVQEILKDLITKVVLAFEPEVLESTLSIEDQVISAGKSMNEDKPVHIFSKTKKPPGRPRKIKKALLVKKITTGARRGRKPKSLQDKESPDPTVVRKIELRQKISRSPLDNIALKQSIEENEYIKSEVQRANRKEAKEAKMKSRRANVLAVKELSLGSFEQRFRGLVAGLYPAEATVTESEMSDAALDSSDHAKTRLDYYLSKCKPCSVVLTDFIKQLQIAQQKASDSMDEDTITEAEDSVDDSVDNSEGLGDTDTDKYEGTDEFEAAQDEKDEMKTVRDVADDKESKQGGTDQSSTSNEGGVLADSSAVALSTSDINTSVKDTSNKEVEVEPKSNKIKTPQSKKKSLVPKKIKTKQHQTARKSTDQQKPFSMISPEEQSSKEQQKSPKLKKIPEHQTARKSIDHQTARKTVPPLKIKLTGGMRKTYMVESTEQALDMLASPLPKPLKKRKSKSSSKSGSDSDRANKGHHHHHRKKRNKSPLVGQVGVFTEKKSKPTAIVAASPSVKPSPHVPKDPYEATFLEFIQQKEKDIGRLPVKEKPFLDILNNKDYKVDNGSLMVTASCQSKPVTSSASVSDNKSQASLYSSISKNTSLVNSVINDNLNKVLEGSTETNVNKDSSLFIGVMGARSNLHYFCSRCDNEMHKTDDLVLKHFALVHPGEPIMYRRVHEEPKTTVASNETASLMNISGNQKLSASIDDVGTSQSKSANLPQSLEHPYREEGEESDTGSLNLKIVDVISLKDQIHPLDEPEGIHPHDKQPQPKGQGRQDTRTTNIYTPELKIPHFPRSSSSSRENLHEHGLMSPQLQQPIEGMQIVQTTSSLKPTQRKTPGLITPGRLCNTFKCEKCNVHAPVLAAMVAHLRNTHQDIPRLFQCPYCRDKEAESEAQIHQHIRKNHPTDNPNPPVALSEKAKGNLRTLSVRVPDNKANDASFLEKDIYMCLNCKIHMPSLEAIYDHLEQVHTEVFVFVCSACKVFKSKTEKDVLKHIQTDARCSMHEKNISLAIDGNQFTRVPCLIKDKNKHKEKHIQPKVSHSQPVVSKQTPSHGHTAQSRGQVHTNLAQSHTPSQAMAFTPSSIVQALQAQPFSPPQFLAPGLPMQQLIQYPFGQMLAQPVMSQFQQTSQFTPVPVSQSTFVVSAVSTPTPTLSLSTASTQSSTFTPSTTTASIPVTSATPSVSTAPTKPTGAKKRKNLLESIQHIKMQKQLEQQAKLEKCSSSTSESVQEPSSGLSTETESSPNSQAPPPLIRGPPPLIRYDQLNNIPLSAAVPLQSGVIPQHTIKQVSSPLQTSNSDATKQGSLPRRQIQSSLFDTSDPEAFKPIQRTPVLNVPSVSRPIRAHGPVAQQLGSKVTTQKPSSGVYTPLDLSKTTPTPSPASTPPAPEKPVKQSQSDLPNPDVYNVFNLKPSTQAQLPKQALQNKTAVHQLPPKAPAPPMPVRPNAANTLAYRPQQPHIATSQVPQVINMPLGMLNNINNISNIGNIMVTMPSFQVVQGMPVQAMPTQFIRMTSAQLINSPTGQGSVAVAMPTAQGVRPILSTQQGALQQPMNVNLPVFKCPYCPKLISLTFAQVQPHIESQHPGCSVVFMPIVENKK